MKFSKLEIVLGLLLGFTLYVLIDKGIRFRREIDELKAEQQELMEKKNELAGTVIELSNVYLDIVQGNTDSTYYKISLGGGE